MQNFKKNYEKSKKYAAMWYVFFNVFKILIVVKGFKNIIQYIK